MVSIIRGYLRRIKKAKVCMKLLEFLEVKRNLLLSRRLNNKQNVGQDGGWADLAESLSARSRIVGDYAFFCIRAGGSCYQTPRGDVVEKQRDLSPARRCLRVTP